MLNLLTEMFQNRSDYYSCQNSEALLNELVNFFGLEFIKEYNESKIDLFTDKGIDLDGLRVICTGMALKTHAKDLHTFRNFNQLLKEKPEILGEIGFATMIANQKYAGLTPFQIENLVAHSENPFISLIHLTHMHQCPGKRFSAHSKVYAKRAKTTFEGRYKHLSSSFVMANNHLFSGALIEQENRAYAAFNQSVVSMADRDIPTGSLVQMLNDNGDSLKLYQAHQLINYKGIRATAFTTFNPGPENEIEIRAIFHGTHGDSSIVADLEKNFPGYASMVEEGRQDIVLNNLNKMVEDIRIKHPDAKIKLSFVGHSLGGALAQTVATKWLEEKAIHNSLPLYSDVNTVNIFTKCAPKLTREFNEKAQTAIDHITQDPDNNLSLGVYRLTQHGDIVHKIGEAHFLENMLPHQGFYSSMMVSHHEGLDAHNAHGLYPERTEVRTHQNNLTEPFRKERTHLLNNLFDGLRSVLHPVFTSIFNLKQRSEAGLALKPASVETITKKPGSDKSEVFKP